MMAEGGIERSLGLTLSSFETSAFPIQINPLATPDALRHETLTNESDLARLL